ncbi:response regulator [Enterococcus sp. BWM-S5]|uniref:Response regulator n=1 Tax=Enterococcus larvae TaxID=2794352 RepID=A0ABS4CNQ1_9ENTE|nr:response regulator [Enterococcus larvae]MBP1048080.1 response regulator [Enterococcus larvae]
MRKLLIVEDEWIIRKALMSLPWETIGVTEIFEADNGQKGLECYRENIPQVVLSDINMPFVDGLAMGKEIASLNKACQIIFLTGYSEFSYAQSAVSLKAFDYILKPVDASVLLPQVDEAFKLVEEEAMNEQASWEYQRRELVKGIILSKKQEGNEQINTLFPIDSSYLCMCYFLNKGTLEIPSGFQKEVLRLEDNTYFALIHLRDQQEAFYRWQNSPELREFLNRQEGWIGLSIISDQPEVLGEKIVEARISFEKSKFDQPGVYVYDPQRSRLDFSPVLIELEQRLGQQIENRAPKRVYEILDSLELNGSLMTLPLSQIRPFLMKQVFMLFQAAQHAIVYDEFTVYQKITSSTVVEEMLSAVKEIAAIWQKNQEVGSKSDTIIQQAKRFIDAHYADEDISLQLVAENIHVSPPYLSNLFKSETGKNYTEYLFGRRMGAAYQLLRHTNKTITDISLETGFTNPNYFSSCFKKDSGLSPKQYRNVYKEEEKKETIK